MAAVYVGSQIEVVNNKVIKDKLITYAASIMKVLEEKFDNVSGAQEFAIICKIKVEVDTSKINPGEILGRDLQFQKLEEQNKKIQQLEEEK